MSAAPLAWLWQNGRILGDDCFSFYATERRAQEEIDYCGGWKTPVFDEGPLTRDAASENDLWLALDQHAPSERLDLSPEYAAAVRQFLSGVK